ncbi:MAG: two-component system response regulator [Flavobacteriales bacterium]|nr:two-component system response regulator [Flavobacteriales bacterium]|tara:strand:+ start:7561 stop:9102 length:1542 start_codon:yes stop_codon:yes gene_type:complete
MKSAKILWIDDEVDSLKSHILFLTNKGFSVQTVSNGYDAIKIINEIQFDIIFLDENMPGLTGLETLEKIKEVTNSPVIMITKNEQEHIMEDAIGAKISDYLIKPVNPNQVLLSIKKNLEFSQLINHKTNLIYQREFMSISSMINSVESPNEWIELYKKIVYWELELESLDENQMLDVLLNQKKDANNNFFKNVKKNYHKWIEQDNIIMSNNLFEKSIFPVLSSNKPTFFLLIDNLRYDQWKIIQPHLDPFFNIDDKLCFSILPTATQYCRNSIFAGMMPDEIKHSFPSLWLDDHQEGGKNMHEKDFLSSLLLKLEYQSDFSFNKIFNNDHGVKLLDRINELLNKSLNVIIYNFVDILSHAKTDLKMIKELAINDKAYRDLTLTWFKNSPLFDLLKKLSSHDCNIIITSDHGTINVSEPSRVVGEKTISSNLRYKTGKKMKFENKDVLWVQNPQNFRLPSSSVSAAYIFASPNKYFVYPNNYNHYAHHYINTYQHGGISMEEMMLPLVSLKSKL